MPQFRPDEGVLLIACMVPLASAAPAISRRLTKMATRATASPRRSLLPIGMERSDGRPAPASPASPSILGMRLVDDSAISKAQVQSRVLLDELTARLARLAEAPSRPDVEGVGAAAPQLFGQGHE